MSTISITKTYENGDILFEADLDAMKSAIETFFNTTGINDDNIQDAVITASSKIIDGTVTTASLASDSIDTEQLATDSVTTAKIADSAVTTAKFAANSVTRAKVADLDIDYSADFSDSVTGINQTATVETVSYTSIGRPVLVAWMPDSAGAATLLGYHPSANRDILEFEVEIFRDSTVIANFLIMASNTASQKKAIEIPATAIWTIDVPAAGTYSYSIKISTGATVGTSEDLTVDYVGRILVTELQ